MLENYINTYIKKIRILFWNHTKERRLRGDSTGKNVS